MGSVKYVLLEVTEKQVCIEGCTLPTHTCFSVVGI
jgi:hypothetical protein